MPNVGDIIQGKLIGLSADKYVWAQCPDCGLERWAQRSSYNPSSIRRCKPCHIQHIRGSFKLKEKH
jgi:hypothetical protein